MQGPTGALQSSAARWVAAATCLLLGLLARDGWVPFLSGVDLGVHEFGHLVTFWAPDVLTAAAGTIAQIAAPLGLAAYFEWGRGERSVAAVLVAWAGTAAVAAAAYIADAPFEELALFGGGEHDWAYLLGPEQCGCLDRARGLAGLVRFTGWCLVLGGAAAALWPAPGDGAQAG
ncbi:MAG TPA: hypothetical protein VNA14_00280 [Mycobacteriales bacterium]|nr:hypothetical protein [Mycobacteriales bacterium]